MKAAGLDNVVVLVKRGRNCNISHVVITSRDVTRESMK